MRNAYVLRMKITKRENHFEAFSLSIENYFETETNEHIHMWSRSAMRKTAKFHLIQIKLEGFNCMNRGNTKRNSIARYHR